MKKLLYRSYLFLIALTSYAQSSSNTLRLKEFPLRV